MPNITVAEAYEFLDKEGHCLLDVRTAEEVQELSVPGAIHIPLDRLSHEAPKALAVYKTIHVMCRSGGRSAMATQLLHQLGIVHAKNVAGGILAWDAAGLPTQ